MTQEKLTALFEFDKSGKLKAVFLNSQDDQGQAILEKALQRILKPEIHVSKESSSSWLSSWIEKAKEVCNGKSNSSKG